MGFSKSLRRKTLRRKTLRRKTLKRKSRKGGAALNFRTEREKVFDSRLTLASEIISLLKPRGYYVPDWLRNYFADIMKDNDVNTFRTIMLDSHTTEFTRDQLQQQIREIFSNDTRGNNSNDRSYKKLLIEIDRN
jgi:hypothetical protein